jgi:hypothetical protein
MTMDCANEMMKALMMCLISTTVGHQFAAFFLDMPSFSIIVITTLLTMMTA